MSHRTAAHMWKLPVPPTTAIHVTVSDRRFRKAPPWVVIHRVRLPPGQCTTCAGLPTTARARTVVDLLRTERPASACDLLDRALQQEWLDLDTLRRAIADGRGRTGNVALRSLLATTEPGAHAESERRLHAVLRRGRLRGWVAQYPIELPGGTVFVDVAFPEQRVAIEMDGRRYHDEFSDRFEFDRLRQNQIVLLGWRVLRFTWRTLRDDPDLVLSRIVQLLAA